MFRRPTQPTAAAEKRPFLNLPELAYLVLNLDFNHLPPPAVEGQFNPIQARVPEKIAYYMQYEPLIVEETIAVIRAALDKGQTKTDYLVQQGASDQSYYYPNEDVSVITLRGENRIDCAKEMSSARFIVAAILARGRLITCIIEIFHHETRVVLKGNYQDFIVEGGSFKITPLGSLVNLDRMYSICKQAPDSFLLQRIREAKVSAWPALADSANAASAEIPGQLNEGQQHAVTSFVSAQEGLYLLQGPPGTGKTTTIVEMLRGLTTSTQRTLVCAPSNKAVQVLALRALEQLPNEPILLIGVSYKVPKELEPISWDNWVERYPERLKKLLIEMDVISQLSPSDAEDALYPRANRCIDFQRLSVLLQQLSQKEETIKQLLSGCLRYATALSLEDRMSIKQRVSAGLAQYFQLLASLQKLSFPTAFPALSSRVVKVALPDLAQQVESVQLEMRECYHNVSQEILTVLATYVPQEQDYLLAFSSVVFCTLSIAGRPSLQRQCRQQPPFAALIVDEAGQSVEAETLIAFSLAQAAEKAVLVGDPRQLPATTIARSSQESNFEWSMLWRLVEENKQPVLPLSVQYRMRPHISHFPSSRYYESKLLGHPSIGQRVCHSAHCIPREGLSCWVNVNGREEKFETSYINRTEASAVVALVKALRARDRLSQIGIISFYGQQVALLRKLLSEFNDDKTTVATVDGFQGDEKDIVIVSFVRANDESRIGFLGDFRRLNVAITRAKDALFLAGDAKTYSRLPQGELRELWEFHRQIDRVIPLEKALANIAAKRQPPQLHKPKPLPVVKPIGSVTNPVMRYVKGSAAATKPEQKQLTAEDLYNADELINFAQRLAEQMKYEAAIDRYNTALQRDPNRPDIYERIATCYDALEEPANASMMRDIARSLKNENSQHPPAAAASSASRVPVKIPVAAVPCEADRFTVVGASAKKQMKAIKDGIAQARRLSDQGDFSQAVQVYQALLVSDPAHSEVLLGLGWALHKQREHQKAAEQFERSLKVNKSPLAYQGLIQCKRYLGEREEALDLVYQALDHFPWFTNIHRLKHELEGSVATAARSGVRFFSEKKVSASSAAAAASAASVPRNTPKPSSVWAAAAMFQPSNGQKKPSVRLLPSAKKVSRQEITHVRDLSQGKKRPDLAAAACMKLLEREPNHVEVLREMGWALLSQKKDEEAIPFFLKSLEMKKDPSAYYGLARGYYHSARKREALAVIDDCLSFYPHGTLPIFDKIKDFRKQLAPTPVSRAKVYAGRF